ncbi:protein-L-isoaspartate O-methyltransferase family protein [Pseudogemmobacter sonorensis]|uniref:protein-L-isoaspartate O-methyltransferase family protein n=1 Tax=Pseudogemmobacter sonorensis TaxID=2989681 RepID=UPI0036AB175A
MSDFATRRMFMVDTQVRPSDVTKFPIIEAMLETPREVYVPPDRREAAYVGTHVELAPGRVLVEPRTLAKLLDALDILPSDRVLVLGAGLGYSAAVLARMVGTVVAVEEDADLAADAGRILSEQGVAGVSVVAAPLTAGAPETGPYDVILVDGGVEAALPAAIEAQLAEGGRIGAVFMEGALGTARIGHRVDGRVNWRYAFNAAAPVLPGFEESRSFAL